MKLVSKTIDNIITSETILNNVGFQFGTGLLEGIDGLFPSL